MNEITTVSTEIKPYSEGFRKGFNKIPVGNVPEAKKALFEALGISANNRYTWGRYLNGAKEPKASQAAAVEAVFRKYGITEVWGK